jgi:prefoldin subunit 5
VTVDERIEALTTRHEALTMNLELMSHEIQDLLKKSRQDGEAIAALARIAEIHERRLTALEGGSN